MANGILTEGWSVARVTGSAKRRWCWSAFAHSRIVHGDALSWAVAESRARRALGELC
jgi:hypothetical protein